MHKDSHPSSTQQTLMQRFSVGLLALRTFMGKPLARWLVLGLFVVQATMLVFATNIGTPPDENNNIAFVQYYADHSLGPVFDNQTPTNRLGDKTREVDYLYHYGMSFVMRALPFSQPTEVKVVRLFSVGFGLLSFVVLARLLKRLGVSAAAIASTLLILTNLPMVLMLSAAVNNDSLVWLGMGLGLLLIVRLLDKPSLVDLAWLMALCFTGGLAKRTMLPFCVIFGIWGLAIAIRHWRVLLAQLKPLNWSLVAAAVVILLGLGLFAERVGGNIVRYGTVQVTCEQVHGVEACKDFWISARARELAKRPSKELIPVPIFVGYWLNDNFNNIVDIQTQFWQHKVKPARMLTPLLDATLVVGLVYGIFYEIRRFAREATSRYRVYVMAVALVFMAVQLAVNLSTYTHFRVYGIALNGRYIIPSLLPLAGLAGFYWSRILVSRPRLLILLTLLVAVCTIGGSGLLMMLRNSQLYAG